MSGHRGAGAKAPALPVRPEPAFKKSEIVWDITKSQTVEILGDACRYERIQFKCSNLHYGQHVKDCKREVSYWFQYHVAAASHTGRHNATRVDYHVGESELSWIQI